MIFIVGIVGTSKAQYIYPVSEFSEEMKDVELSNFEIQNDVLFLPLGESGLHIWDINDINNFRKLFVYKEFEKRSGKKIFGVAHCIQIIENRAYLSYGSLGLKILDISDPTMPFVLGTYYRYQDVYCTEIYDHFAFLGYIGMGLEIVDFGNLDDIKMVSRNNVRDFTVNNIQLIPPFVMITGGKNGIRSFKFNDPFTDFKQVEFPKDYITDNEAHKLVVNGKIAYLANDFKGIIVLNVGLPLYPLKLNTVKTEGRVTELIVDKNYIYAASGKYIEVFDISDPEKPSKVFEHLDKDKNFVSLKMHNNNLFALYSSGNKEYGIVIFQVE